MSESASVSTAYYPHRGATIYDKPAITSPIDVAAAGPVFANNAGHFADGFICTTGKARSCTG